MTQVPTVGMTVLYYPSPEEGFQGGFRPLPAIVVGVDGPAPEFDLHLAVIDPAARMVARNRPLSLETWIARGRPQSLGHWEYIAA